MTDVASYALAAAGIAANGTGPDGRRVVLREISLHVAAGECVGVAAAHGATAGLLLRVLATLVRPTSGHVRINGVDAIADPYAARCRVAFAAGASGSAGEDCHPHDGIDPRLTVEEHLRFILTMRRSAAAGRARGSDAVGEITSRIGVGRERALGVLPAHERVLLAIASCVLSTPDVLLVEEPAAGFGEVGGRALALIDRARNSGTAVVLAASSDSTRGASCERWLRLDEHGYASENRRGVGTHA
jgi:ABC-type Na+ transport system ATPase subunit NatA